MFPAFFFHAIIQGMKTLLKNLTIIPVTKEGLHFTGDILIEDRLIRRIGDCSKEKADTVRDCTGLIAIPGLVNAHTHLSMTLMRNYKDTCSNLQEWLGEIFPIEDRLGDEEIYWGSMLGLAELIKSGTTSFADMYFHQWMTARACKEAGVRGFLSLTIFGDEEETRKRLSSIRLDDELDGDLLRRDLAVHAIYTCSEDSYRYTADWAREHDAIVNTHLSETKKEMTDCLEQSGMLPAFWLEKTGFLDLPCYVAHGVWLQDEEVKLLASKGVSVVHNPSSNCKLASGIAPVGHFRKLGLNVALGTDGASSNNNLSMIKEMRLAAMLSTVSTMDVGSLRPYQILEMATVNGAKALHAESQIGTLEEGKKADIVLINPAQANMTPLNDIFSALVFSLSENNIDSVYVSGRQLLDKGRLTTIDEAEVCRNVARCWERIRKGE